MVLWLQERTLGLFLLTHDRPRATLHHMAPLEPLRKEGEEPEVADTLDTIGPHGRRPLFAAVAEVHPLLAPGYTFIVACQLLIHGVPLLSKSVANRAKAHFLTQASWQCIPDIPGFHGAAQRLAHFEERGQDGLVFCGRCFAGASQAEEGTSRFRRFGASATL